LNDGGSAGVLSMRSSWMFGRYDPDIIRRGLLRFAALLFGIAVIFAVVGLGIGALGGADAQRSVVGGLLAGGILLTLVALFSAVGGPGRARPFARGAPTVGVGGYLLTDEVSRKGVGDLGVSLAVGVSLIFLALAVSELV
jgi:hypothetical protein